MKVGRVLIKGCVYLILVGSPIYIASQVTLTNAPASTAGQRDELPEMVKHVMTNAELAIKASDRALTIMLWVLGIFGGSSTIGVAALWMWISRFREKMHDEIMKSQSKADNLLESAGRTASIFEQILCSLPMLFIDGIDQSNKVIALNTLAQLRRTELAPIFETLLKKSTDTGMQAAAVYALGLLEKGATKSVGEILKLSHNPDYNLRRECARALTAVGADSREIRMRLEEMTKDADDIVKKLAQNGLRRESLTV